MHASLGFDRFLREHAVHSGCLPSHLKMVSQSKQDGAGTEHTLILLLRQGSHDPARLLVFFLGSGDGGLGGDIFLLGADDVRSLFQCKNTVS
jgi:hypothetical protein